MSGPTPTISPLDRKNVAEFARYEIGREYGDDAALVEDTYKSVLRSDAAYWHWKRKRDAYFAANKGRDGP